MKSNPNSNPVPVADRIMWADSLEARCTIYCNGVGSYEVYTQKAGSIPVRYNFIKPSEAFLQLCIWTSARQDEDFVLPAETPAQTPIN